MPPFIYNRPMFGQSPYTGVFTPSRPGQRLSVPEAKPFSYSTRSSGPRLEVPNQNPGPAPAARPQTLADRLAALNLPGLVEGLGLQNQLTRPQGVASYGVGVSAGQSVSEEQAIGRESLAAYERMKAENRSKYAGLLDILRKMGIVDSSRLVDEPFEN